MGAGVEQSYFEVSKNKVSHSEQIADDVIVDYDAKGGIVGLEFLSAAAAGQRDKYLTQAGVASRARLTVPAMPKAGKAAAAA